MSKSGIKNIILDLGEVLVNLDISKTIQALQLLFKPEFPISTKWVELPELVLAYETGKWNDDEFYAFIRQFTLPGVSNSDIDKAWSAMLLGFPRKRVEIIQKLSVKYDVFLLSNTNPIHIRHFENEFKESHGFELQSIFKQVYYSSSIGHRKPMPDAFLTVVREHNLNPSETIMVDDREENCNAAELCGLKAIRVQPETGLEAVVDQLF